MAMTVMYNGVQFAPVTTKHSIVVPHSAEVVWSVVGCFGRAASWMGSVEGQRTFSQLLGGETVDYIGAVRVFGVADKLLFEQLVQLDKANMSLGWQLMTHPMNSNPFPAAFVNFKADLQVWPVSIPTNSNQCFVEWHMNLLTEEHAVDLMTQSMRDIMEMSLTNLLRYMDKSSNNSGGSSAGSHGTAGGGGIVGSTTAPLAYGIQFMPQPQAIPQHIPPLSQAMASGALSGNSPFLQQPSFVPAPGQNLGTAVSAAAMGPFQQHHLHPPMHGPFSQQQFAKYQANPGLYPHQYPQYQQQPQSSMFQQQQQQQQAAAHQLQQQQAAAHQLQQQTQHLGLYSAGGSGSSSHHSSQYAAQRPLQRNLSSSSQKGISAGQPGAELGSGINHVPLGEQQLSARYSQEKLQEAPQQVGQPQPAGVGHVAQSAQGEHMTHMAGATQPAGPGQQAGLMQTGQAQGPPPYQQAGLMQTGQLQGAATNCRGYTIVLSFSLLIGYPRLW